MTPEFYVDPKFDLSRYRRHEDDVYISTYCSEGDTYIRFITPEGSYYNSPASKEDNVCDKPKSVADESAAPEATEFAPDGTLMSKHCSGLNMVGIFSDGKGSFRSSIISENSVECGWKYGETPEIKKPNFVMRAITKARSSIANGFYAAADFIAVERRYTCEDE